MGSDLAIPKLSIGVIATVVVIRYAIRGWESWGDIICVSVAAFVMGLLHGLFSPVPVSAALVRGFGAAVGLGGLYWQFGGKSEASSHPRQRVGFWPIILVLVAGAIAAVIDAVADKGSIIWWSAAVTYAGTCGLAAMRYGRTWIQAWHSAHRRP